VITEFDLLRLEGLWSEGIEEDGDVVYVHARLTDPEAPTCKCDAADVVKHGKRTVDFRDLPLQRQKTFVRITRQRYRCRACGSVLLQDLDCLDSDRVMTVRFRRQIEKDGIEMKFIAAANINGINETMVRRVFKEYAKERLSHYTFELPRVLGMDEKVLGGTARFVIGDVENRFLLDILLSRKQSDLIPYFKAMSGRQHVEVITQDMFWGYKTLNEECFPRATIVVDRFHVTRYADWAVMSVRKAIQAKMTNEDRIAMKKNIPLLQARPDRLDHSGKWELGRIFKQHPAIEQAVTLKEWFYDLYECQTRAEAEKAFDAWLELVPPEMERHFKPILSFMRTKRWREFVFNYFDHRYTNGYIEGLNSLFSYLNFAGRGYNLNIIRAKALLRYGKVEPLIDKYAFALRLDDPETETILNTVIGHGVDISTFERDLITESFW
jgi:transposase